MSVPALGGGATWPMLLARSLAVGLCYYLFARLGLLIPYVGTHVSLIWLPTGVAVAAYLRWGAGMAPAIYLSALAANVVIGGPAWMSLGIATGNTLGPALAAWLLRRWHFDTSLVRRRDLIVFLAAVALGMLVTSINGSLWLVAGQIMPVAMWPTAWATWWTGDAVGALLGGVPLAALSRRTLREAFDGPAGRGNLLLLGLVALCSGLSFSTWLSPNAALLFPLLALPFFISALLALRGGALAASLAALLVAGAAAWGTARGLGPFASPASHGGLLALWSYVTAQACTSLLIWVLGAELLSSRRQLDALFLHANEGLLVIGAGDRVLALNPAACALLGLQQQDTVGRLVAELPNGHGDVLARWLEQDALPGGGPRELDLAGPLGTRLRVEAQTARFLDAGGQWQAHLMLRDVTARAEAENRLAHSERRLRTITDNTPALIAYIDRAQRFTFANATHFDWLGIRPEAMIGRDVDESFGGATRVDREALQQALDGGERVSFEFEAELAGRRRHLRGSYVPDRASDGAVRGVYVLTMDVSEQKAVEAQLTRMARFDPLTSLPNRYQFEDSLSAATERCAMGVSMALLFIDVDHFKAINDTQGHGAGDEVLKEFARRLKQAVRESDLVARLAGDEFVVLLQQLRGEAEAERVAQKMVAAMLPPFELSGGPTVVGTSIGVAWCQGGREVSPSQVTTTADEALYEAKRAGRGTYRIRACQSLLSMH